jgi:signal transduction histidine kinase
MAVTVGLKTEVADGHIQSLEIQLARLEMLLEVSRQLNATLELDALLQSLLEVAVQLIDAGAAAVLLLEAKTGEPASLAVTRKAGDGSGRIMLPLDNSLAGWIIRTGEPLVIENLPAESGHFSEVDHVIPPGTRLILGVPLKVQEETLGVLEVFDKHADTGFSGADIHLLQLLAAQAAVAIKNARLFCQNDQLVHLLQVLQPPLAGIIETSQQVLASFSGSASPQQPELQRIHGEARQLQRTVHNFSDLIQLETGRSYPQRQPLDLQPLVQEVIVAFSERARAQEIGIFWYPEPAPKVSGDPARLRQVMEHLLDNAIRYNSRPGRIEVSLFPSQVRVQVAIRDTGQGLAPADLDLIFNRFYRVANGRSTDNTVGLGLPLVKKIIEAHGGDIWVQSQLGIGSTFTFSLPVADTLPGHP